MPRKPKTPDIAPLELADALEGDAQFQIVDVRAPARVAASGRIDLVPDDSYHNIVGSRLVTVRSPQDLRLNPARPVAVVCGHGNDSKVVAQHLISLGYDARSLAGGMAAWMLMAVPRPLRPPRTLDHLTQFDRVGKGALGYVLVSDGEALIIDPPRDATPYLAHIASLGAQLVGVADTHVHADYLSGAPALQRMTSVPYYLHPADVVYPYDGTPGHLSFHAIGEGDRIAFGRVSVSVHHTPGHTEGSVTYIVDAAAALTGDFIFVESVGRPDLAGKTAEWTTALWSSLERARREWPDRLAIYPAHYTSEAERNADRTIGAPLGELKRSNAALGIESREAFTAWVAEKSRAFPEAYREIKAINVGLKEVDEARAEALEVGKNECALL